MKCLLPLLALALAACSGTKTTNNNPDSGSTPDSGNTNSPIITVSGTASIHPAALGWMQDAGLTPPSLAGLTLSVDEPFKVALGDSHGHFGEVTLDATGAFSVPNVDTAQVVLGIAAAVRDERPGVCDGGLPVDGGCAGGAVVNAASGVYDVQLQGGIPTGDVDGGKAYAVPLAFHDQLTAAVGPSVISGISSGTQNTLLGAGFILGRIVDAQGNPVSGASVELIPSTTAAQLFYVADDFRSVNQLATGATGLFVYVHTGSATVTTFTLKVNNDSEYLGRNAGAVAGAALVLTVFPGTVQP
jgi:hypothetical protein